MDYFKRVKVWSEDLAPGMFVAELDRPWEESNFLLQGFKLEGPHDVEAVQRQCRYVYVDFESEAQFKRFKLQTSKSSTYKKHLEESLAFNNQSFNFDIKPALTRRKQTKSILKSVFDKIALGQDFDVTTAHDSVKENVKEILQNESAMLVLAMLSESNADIADHCFAVSILSICFAKQLGYSQVELEDIGLAALLHDIGHMRVDNKVLNKYGRLNADERKLVEEHPKYGFDIISSKPGLTKSCIDVIYSHHERIDGSGYPRGLKTTSITPITQLISLVDVYESKTRQQSYRKGSPIVRVYKMLLEGKNTIYDGKLLMQFIQWRGIYPPGSIVELEDGRVGIVIAIDRKNKLQPVVLQILDQYKQKVKEQIISAANDSDFKIINAFENNAFGIYLHDYLEKGLKIRS
ncbi:DUF3391 domain-containing protein [Aliikangiella marina]|uniref:DUF3391 domain-containing protein n=1 Tax=Aliikangiella marina TaxID=1712262 RepID=A0A545T6A3_9GAMM|nr:HD-GYP domain-containing protein [Aliikangiella marina]TQV72760.1 DUF3391 domain-containing protein [Aliikangiella marina]